MCCRNVQISHRIVQYFLYLSGFPNLWPTCVLGHVGFQLGRLEEMLATLITLVHVSDLEMHDVKVIVKPALVLVRFATDETRVQTVAIGSHAVFTMTSSERAQLTPVLRRSFTRRIERRDVMRLPGVSLQALNRAVVFIADFTRELLPLGVVPLDVRVEVRLVAERLVTVRALVDVAVHATHVLTQRFRVLERATAHVTPAGIVVAVHALSVLTQRLFVKKAIATQFAVQRQLALNTETQLMSIR